ncbi:MAG: MBL fold metallo-hydrolase [Promethearchaeota archaeon]
MNDLVQMIKEEFKDIYFVPGQREGKYPYSHSMIIGDYLIDTGISSGFNRKLRRSFKINNVILSHWHEDHISGNRFFPDATFYAHQEDIPVIENIDKMFEYYQVFEYPEQEELFRSILDAMKLKDTNINVILKDNDIINLRNGLKLKVIHTPGHTKGHCCFYETISKISFLADIDLSSLGPWYGGMDSNVRDFEESIIKIGKLDIEIAITSHKGIIVGRAEVKRKIQDYLNIIYERDERILSELSENSPRTSKDLMKKNLIYPRYTSFEEYEILAEKIMIDFHFDKFLKQNKIQKKKTGYILV